MADTDEDTGSQETGKGLRAQLEAALAEAKQAKVDAENARRELAFTQAGLTGLSDKQVKALVATHEGEITADALKATATELGFVADKPPATDNKPAVSEQPAAVTGGDVDTARELAQLAGFTGGATPPPAPEGAVDLDQFQTAGALMDFLRQNVGNLRIE